MIDHLFLLLKNEVVDGKGPSVWDHMTHTKPRKVKKKENGDVACDFYNRFHDDIPLVKEMNFQVFRFSIAWTRIFPIGTGTPNQKGVDFYHRVIDRCLEHGCNGVSVSIFSSHRYFYFICLWQT